MLATFTWSWGRIAAAAGPFPGYRRWPSAGGDHGVDTDAEGYGVVTGDRLYQLVRQQGSIMDRTFRIEFLVPGVRAYSFTFG